MTSSLARGAVWTHWYRRALPAYWLFLFSVTHFPALQLGGPPGSDKMTHVVGFAILTFLFWRFVETLGQPLTGRFVWIALAILGLYAAFDEWSQAYVGRGTDLADWIADMIGVCGTLLALEAQRRVRNRRERPAAA